MSSDLHLVSDPPAAQRWAPGRRPAWVPHGPTVDPRRYGVVSVDEATCRAYVLDRHYSGSMPATIHRLALIDQHRPDPVGPEGCRMVGAAVFSAPAQAAVLTNVLPDLQPYVESVDLGRFVLDDAVPANGESWFLARCFSHLADRGVRGVVSFADPMPRHRLLDGVADVVFPGHVGRIYQASNAVYTGRSSARRLTLRRDGTVFSDRAAAKIRRLDTGWRYAAQQLVDDGATPLDPAVDDPAQWLRSALAAAGTRRVAHPGNHRYVFRLGGNRRSRARVRVALDPRPYPRRVDPVQGLLVT